jgi:plasmid stabilization system protein ParE
MIAKQLEIHPAVVEEMKRALHWYFQRSESAALNLRAELERALKLVTEFPQRWPSGERGTRKFVLRRFPFAVFYRERENTIEVIAFAHGYRRPGYWQERLRGS